MTALTGKTFLIPAREKKDFTLRVAGGVTIYPGAKCAVLNGFVQPVDETPGLRHFCVATNRTTVDNSGGGDGDLTCSVEFDEPKFLAHCTNDTISPITAADIGKDAFAVDDSGVVSADPTGRTRIGTPWLIVSPTDALGQRAGVYVEIDKLDSIASATALDALAAAQTELLALAAVETELSTLASNAATIPAMQAVDATLAAGTITINTVITVAANSEVIAYPKGAITGSTNFACVRELVASRVNGAPGVGTLVIEALTNAGVLDADAAGAIRVVILTPQS